MDIEKLKEGLIGLGHRKHAQLIQGLQDRLSAANECLKIAVDSAQDYKRQRDQLRAKVNSFEADQGYAPYAYEYWFKDPDSEKMVHMFTRNKNVIAGYTNTYLALYAAPQQKTQADSVHLGYDVNLFKIAGLVDILPAGMIDELHKWKNVCVALEMNKLQSVEISGESNLLSLGMDQPWSMRECIKKLIGAAGILLDQKSYDGHGHEEIREAQIQAYKYLNEQPKQPVEISGGGDEEKLFHDWSWSLSDEQIELSAGDAAKMAWMARAKLSQPSPNKADVPVNEIEELIEIAQTGGLYEHTLLVQEWLNSLPPLKDE